MIDLHQFAGANRNIHFWLDVVDHFSRYKWTRRLTNKGGKTVADAFRDIINEAKQAPSIVMTDRGSEFFSEEFQTVLKDYNIKYIPSKAYTPQTQGSVESYNGVLELDINKYMTLHKTNVYYQEVPRLVNLNNNIIHSVTRCKPSEVLTNPVLQEKIRKQMDDKKANAPKPLASDLFDIGDHVRVSMEILYELLPQYTRRDKYQKFGTKWSDELFRIYGVHKAGESIGGYFVSYNEQTFNRMIKPNLLLKASSTEITLDIPKESARPPNLRPTPETLPTPTIEERSQRRTQPINYSLLHNEGIIQRAYMPTRNVPKKKA